MGYKFTEKQREQRPNTIPMGDMQPGQFGRIIEGRFAGSIVFCASSSAIIKLYPSLDSWTILDRGKGLSVEILPGYKCELEGV